MEKKLYRVRIVLFVMAENESDARVAATRARFDIFECAARKAENSDSDWNDAIPYNSDDGRTCSEILSDQEMTKRPGEPRSIKLPSYVEAGLRAFESENGSIQPGQYS